MFVRLKLHSGNKLVQGAASKEKSILVGMNKWLTSYGQSTYNFAHPFAVLSKYPIDRNAH